MKNKKKQTNFVQQAGILAAAGIICRIIGLLYRSPLANIIKDEGNGYYGPAYNVYAILLMISSYSIPTAVSKVMAQKLALKEYRNAHKIFVGSNVFVIILCAITSLLAFFGADYLGGLNSQQAEVLKLFAPTIFLSGLLGTLRGYFQAYGSMVQTSISQILEQIANAAASLSLAYIFVQSAAGTDSTEQALRGAKGSAIGTGLGVLIALLFMVWVYALNRKGMQRRMKRDIYSREISYPDIFKLILLMAAPIILSAFIYNINTTLNQSIYSNIMHKVHKLDSKQISTFYGIFVGKPVVLVSIPLAIASSIATAVIPSISGAYEMNDIALTGRNMDKALKTTMLVGIPAGVGLFVLAKPITQLLFPQPESLDLASSLLRVLSISVFFYSLSTITNSILQGIGKAKATVVNATAALIIQSVFLMLILRFTSVNLYGLALANIVYSGTVCILNQVVMKKTLSFKQDLINTYVKPAIAALLMGIVAFGTYQLVYFLIKSNVISLMISICFAVAVYFVAVMVSGIFTVEEIKRLPKGELILQIAHRLHLLR
ncbi:MAG TPA: polysaccharide biosynthesis protein [Candidatus Merdenecus merdavium]|nr:polysaccharide biosynthesis protein [Candidatus Merdenecus merdavium]